VLFAPRWAGVHLLFLSSGLLGDRTDKFTAL
jgi:hypothetical protein